MIDLCVVNYNTAPLVDRLIETLYTSTLTDMTRIWNLQVADNGSPDNSLEILRRLRDKYGFVLYENENVGYSTACNRMAALGSGDIVACLNADTWFTDADLRWIQDVYDSDPSISVYGPKQLDETGFVRHAGIIGTNTAPVHRGWSLHDPHDEYFKILEDCVMVMGSATFVRRTVWDALTNDPEYREIFPQAEGALWPTFHFYEETGLCYFARHRGYRVTYDGRVTIGHSWHKSSPIGGMASSVYFPQSKAIFQQACLKLGIT